VLGTTQTVAHCSTLKAYPTDLVSVEDHIAALGERYGDLANASVILAGCHGSCRRRYLAGAIIHNIARNTLPCISVSLGLPPPVRRTPCNDSLL
jgi:hypothetical protein